MTVSRYLVGVILVAIAFVPVFAASRCWRQRLLPSLDTALGLLADVVLSMSVVVCLGEALGSVHAFRLAPLTVTYAVVGGAGWLVAVRWRPCSLEPVNGPFPIRGVIATSEKGTRIVALVATSVLAADWAGRTVDALHHGMTNVDTLWYHMPFAARFAETGSTLGLHSVDTEPVVQFYPANSELFHALGIVFLGNDVISPLMNLGWMGLVLLAAWCIGRPFGVAPVTLIGATVLLGTPGFVATQPGGAYNDVVGLALFFMAIALLTCTVGSDGHLRTRGVALASLAAGLSFGTKFTLVGPVILLTLGVWAVCPKGRRLRDGGLWLGLMALTGGYWYVRNWVLVGNPLPSLSHLGPISLPSPPIASPNTTFGHYLFQGSLWQHFFIPGFRSSLGPAWWAILACSFTGLALMIAASSRGWVCRMLAMVGVGSLIVFIYTPQFLGLPGAPIYFVYNLRYASPALLLGLVLLPLVPRLCKDRRPLWVGGILLAILMVTQLDGTIWPWRVFAGRFAVPVQGVDSVIGLLVGGAILAIGLLLMSGRSSRLALPRATLIAAVVVLVLVVGYPLQQFYLDHRYLSRGAATVIAPRTVAWAQGLEHTRIALGGDFMELQYPYYGRYSTNYVQLVTKSTANGNLVAYPTCAQWREALHAGRYRYLVSLSDQQKRWTGSDPSARLIRSEVLGKNAVLDVFRLGNRLNLAGCS